MFQEPKQLAEKLPIEKKPVEMEPEEKKQSLEEEEPTEQTIEEDPTDEDISNEAYCQRHERGLNEERKKFLTFLKFPYSTR